MLSGKTVVIGVTGGIAAYKAAEVISRLRKMNAAVHVIMTKNACQFITPLTLQTLSQNPVVTDMFSQPSRWEIGHISLAEKADIILVVPATGNMIGKVANGMADDMLSTTIMAAKAPVLFACAMNTNMYENPIVQANISRLSEKGYMFIEPCTGMLACGKEGTGRMAETEDIIEKAVGVLLYKPDLPGKKVLVTAGPTREYFDPVRFITNNSSGKMGYAIARAAAARGAKVTLISGPANLKKPCGVEVIDVVSAQQMFNEVNKRFDTTDILIKAAAVADYRPADVSASKIKKTSGSMNINLQRNPDILKEISVRKGNKVVVGFSMETENLEANAQAKLKEKNLDLIVANDITVKGAGFETDTNVVKILNRHGEIKDYPLMSKQEVANVILDEVLALTAEVQNEKNS